MRRLVPALVLAALTVATAAAAETDGWVMGSPADNPSWTSGKLSNTTVKLLFCATDAATLFGSGYNANNLYMLTGVRGFKDHGSADNFVARLDGKCSGYNGSLQRKGGTQTRTLYNGDEGAAGTWAQLPSSGTFVPHGVSLQVNQTDGYVKDLAITFRQGSASQINSTVYHPKYSLGTTLATTQAEATELSGPVTVYAGSSGPHSSVASWSVSTSRAAVEDTLDEARGDFAGVATYVQCGSDSVLTGLKIWVDTRKDKIRKVQASCRPVHLQ
jgi:hypothetical protein